MALKVRTTKNILVRNILDFWLPDDNYHDFWFDKSVDEFIIKNYKSILEIFNNDVYEETDLYKLLYQSKEGKLALIILFDQFTRNIYRDSEKRYMHDSKALKLTNEILKDNLDMEYTLSERLFILMPYRHSKNSDLLDIVTNKIKLYEIENSCDLLTKFKIATYQSYTNLTDRIKSHNNIKCDNFYRYIDIMDTHCVSYITDKKMFSCNLYDILNMKLYKVLEKYFKKKKLENIGISLSGGVDSMVILYLCHILQKNNVIKRLCAIHLEYCNRDESKYETDFIIQYCNYLDVPIFIRKIDYMSRTSVDRLFYESETTKIRFNSYKYLIEKYNIHGFCLGHHHGDICENTMMNIFNGSDPLSVSSMDDDSVINGVRILRPLLNNKKSIIYETSQILSIPYFKDTTPDWSCRGVLRRKVLPPVIEQWKEPVMDIIFDFSAKSKELNTIVETMILEPLYNKIKYTKYGCLFEDIYNMNFKYSFILWKKILNTIFTKLKLKLCTNHCINEFIEKMDINIKNNNKFVFSNNCVSILKNNKIYIFTFNNIPKCTITYEMSEECSNNIIQYDDLLNGVYTYYINCNDVSKLKSVSIYKKNNYLRKTFNQVLCFNESLPKYDTTDEINRRNITDYPSGCFIKVLVSF
jgi:tRNA(Ile)-lysidine synthetase-like protein